MIVVDVHISKYCVPFARNFLVAGNRIMHREGVLVRIEDIDGYIGVGEAAPATWIDGSCLKATIASLRSFRALVREYRIDVETLYRLLYERAANGADPNGGADVSAGVAKFRATAPPAVRHAIECALLEMRAERAQVSVAELLRDRPLTSCSVAGLIVAETVEGVSEQLQGFAGRGYETFKLKVGHGSAAGDVARVHAAAELCRSQDRLRVDANRAWDGETARQVLKELAAERLDFVEEPLQRAIITHLAALRDDVSCRIAVDESVGSFVELVNFLRSGACDAVVLKPMRLGGLAVTLQLAELARGAGLQVVVTDSIETSVGRNAVVHLAAALRLTTAVGLGGAATLAADADGQAPLSKPSLRIDGPGFAVRAAA